MSRQAKKAPKKAANGANKNCPGNKLNKSITPRPAPELIPMILGDARALFNKVCKINPATDKPVPAKIADNTLGNRTCVKIISCTLLEGFANGKIAANTSCIGISILPRQMAKIQLKNKKKPRNKNLNTVGMERKKEWLNTPFDLI